jgi:hypothetical protein
LIRIFTSPRVPKPTLVFFVFFVFFVIIVYAVSPYTVPAAVGVRRAVQ